MFTLPFKKISAKDAAVAGGKGASLGEMTNAGIPVPPGFVILASTFDRFIQEADLEADIDAALHEVNHKEIHTVEKAAEEIQALITSAKMPKDIGREVLENFKSLKAPFVAVRSSATSEDSSEAAWAGQLDSYLNTTEKTLLKNVQRCWASLFTPRAIFYRFEKGLHGHHISVAVVIQKMVNSDVSGIAFSVHPVTQDYNQMIIEAGFGLGEAIVSGQITPDSYVLEKKPLSIFEKTVNAQERGIYRSNKKPKEPNEWRSIVSAKGEQQTLSDKEIRELAKLVLHIEKHYGFPVDIEWAQEKKKFYIVQSRPITTLVSKAPPKASKKKDNFSIEKLLSSQKWEHYLTRPFSLFGASLWHGWYDSDALQEFIGMRITNAVLIEEKPGLVAHYIPKPDLNLFWKRNFSLAENERRLTAALAKGERQNEVARAYLSKRKKFRDVFEAINFLAYLGIFAGQVPRALLMTDRRVKPILIRRAEKLRLQSLYPRVLDELVIPLAQKEFSCSREKVLSSTINQLQSGASNYVKGKLFVYLMVNGKEDVYWLDSTENIIRSFHPDLYLEAKEFKGISVFPGVVKGTARIVDIFNYKKIPFSRGDILVSINSNPTYTALIEKAGALVTDEGGMGSHATIIARELKKPGVIGTKIATKVLHDGDVVEVDANKGVVRKL